VIPHYRPSGMADTDRILDGQPMLSVSGHLDDLIGLTRAQDADGLWRALVLPAGCASTDHWFGVHLFKRHHAMGGKGPSAVALPRGRIATGFLAGS